jgi:integrase/recombinase XerD
VKLSRPARELVTLIRRHRLNYRTFNKVAHQVRKQLGMRPARNARRLPKLLADAQLKKFYQSIDKQGNLKHQLMLRLLLFTGLRVSELAHIRIADVDLAQCKIFVDLGKGSKDRYVLFREDFALTLKAYLTTVPDNEYLFESRQKRPYSERMIQYIVTDYAESAGLRAHPHLLRHQILTYLTRSGLSDAQIQLISGHSSRKSLELYQHMGLQDVAEDYQAAVRKLDI